MEFCEQHSGVLARLDAIEELAKDSGKLLVTIQARMFGGLVGIIMLLLTVLLNLVVTLMVR